MAIDNQWDLKEVLPIYNKCVKLLNSNLEWYEKYDAIFKFAKGIRLNYYDPDTTYEEDICAFMDAFSEHVEKIKNIDTIVNE